MVFKHRIPTNIRISKNSETDQQGTVQVKFNGTEYSLHVNPSATQALLPPYNLLATD